MLDVWPRAGSMSFNPLKEQIEFEFSRAPV